MVHWFGMISGFFIAGSNRCGWMICGFYGFLDNGKTVFCSNPENLFKGTSVFGWKVMRSWIVIYRFFISLYRCGFFVSWT